MFIIFKFSCFSKRVIILSAKRSYMQTYFLQLPKYCNLIIVVMQCNFIIDC